MSAAAHHFERVGEGVQNGEEVPLEDSKIKSYRTGRSNIENYWDDMGEEL